MNRSDIISKLLQLHNDKNCDLVDNAVRNILEFLSKSIVNGERIEVRDFGAFSIKNRKLAAMKNPKDGSLLPHTLLKVVYFKSGRGLKARMNRRVNKLSKYSNHFVSVHQFDYTDSEA